MATTKAKRSAAAKKGAETKRKKAAERVAEKPADQPDGIHRDATKPDTNNVQTTTRAENV